MFENKKYIYFSAYAIFTEVLNRFSNINCFVNNLADICRTVKRIQRILNIELGLLLLQILLSPIIPSYHCMCAKYE